MVVQTALTGPKPQLTFLLVHGTFGRNGDWLKEARPDSLAAQLKQEFEPAFDVHFKEVDWGVDGPLWKQMPDNTVNSRLKGAALLAKTLESLPDASPNNRCYLVAHSHGGNVVMYALRNRELLNKISGIVCLSTPFLHYKLANFHRDVPILSLALLVGVAWTVGNPFLWAYCAVYAAVVATLFGRGRFGEDEKSVAEIKAHIDPLRIPSRRDLCTAAGPIPFLAVRPRRDEVGILFIVTQNAGAVLRGSWQFVNTVVRWALWAFMAVKAVGWVRESVSAQLDLTVLDRWMSLIDRFALTPLMLLGTAVLLGMALMRWSFAFDSLPWLPRLDVRSTIVPWPGATVVAVDRFFFFGRHTHVQNQSPPKIRDWICESLGVEHQGA